MIRVANENFEAMLLASKRASPAEMKEIRRLIARKRDTKR